MSCAKLKQLVKSYTNGEVPFEVYRDQRRQIVDDFVRIDEPVNKNDPLQTFLETPPTPPKGKHSFTIKPIHIAVTLITLVLGIAIIIYVPNVPKQADTSSNNKQTVNANKPPAQKLIEAFIQTNRWDEQNINQFILDWQILPLPEKQTTRNTTWFNDFKTELENRLKQQKALVKKSNQQEAKQTEDLFTSLLVTIDPNHFINQPFFTEESITTAKQTIDEKTFSEISTPQATKKSTKTTVTTAEKTLAKTQPETQRPTVKKAPVVQPKKAKATTVVIDEQQIDKLLYQFVQDFEGGNIDALMKLFAADATTNHHSSVDDIRTSYTELFQTTAERKLSFSDFSWQQKGAIIEGNGKYLAYLNPKDTNINQIFSADVDINLDTARQPPVISRLYLTNQQFSTSLKKAPEGQPALPKVQQPPAPSKDELRVLLTNFVTSYNHGDIDNLMMLFSQEASTNDRTNINDIRQDYLQLFETTKTRDIVLKDISWTLSANKAVAIGLFEAKIQPQNNNETRIFRGKIRIAATKYHGDGVLITQLLHNTQ